MRFYTNTETNRIFKGHAQTPTTLFLLKKEQAKHSILSLFCNKKREYIEYNLNKDYPIPTNNIELINLFMQYVDKVGCLKVLKTNMPSKHTKFSETVNDVFCYKNIKTVTTGKKEDTDTFITMNNVIAEKHINWSDRPCIGHNEQKIILAHKMYGYPLFDIHGEYGISNRDNYIITEYNEIELGIITKFLSLPLIVKIYDATRYRMKYLEKYAFQFIPDITKLEDFPVTDISEETVKSYFKINDL